MVEDIVLPAVRGGLWMGPAVMLDALADSSRPTLGRVFDIGRPLHLQAEVAGREVADGSLQLAATLVNTEGAIMREGRPTVQKGARRDRRWVSAVIETNGLRAGRYAMILGARAGAKGSEVNRGVLLELIKSRP